MSFFFCFLGSRTGSESRGPGKRVCNSTTSGYQEDVNGEKLTVKKWWIFGADFSRFAQSFSRFKRDINGEKKSISLLMIFFTVSFSRFTPSGGYAFLQSIRKRVRKDTLSRVERDPLEILKNANPSDSDEWNQGFVNRGFQTVVRDFWRRRG